MGLLSRDEFREGIFQRDSNLCVVCKQPGKDAHHILERRLWPDGGYYTANGVTLCSSCHIEAETTKLSCEYLREKAGIGKVILPPHLYDDIQYDKWGNPIQPNGQRLRGELFDDVSVQKILQQGEVLNLFTKYVKYPRTYHLPWSENIGKDDRVLDDTSTFENKQIVVTIKMDGENTTMYNDHIHARSLDSRHHESRSWVKQLHSQICNDIPEGWRICGENLYAKHSIHYKKLPSYFMLFSIWNDKNVCLSWKETYEWAELLELHMVPWASHGGLITTVHEEFEILRKVYPDKEYEGYVVRNSDSFHYSQFRNNVGKFVRKNHVQTHGHWMREQIVLNELHPLVVL